jgi:hypothetical protein
MLSGGQDSEVVVKAFLEAGVPFELLTYRFSNDENMHEMCYVDVFCKRHGLTPTYYDFDIRPWIQSKEAAEFFEASKTVHAGMLPHMKVMKHIVDSGGYPILGNGEVLLKRHGTKWNYIEYEYDLAWYRFAEAYSLPSCAGFFQENPEIMLAALLDPITIKLGVGMNKTAMLLDTSTEVKYDMYKSHWSDIVRRPKYRGGELIYPFFPMMTKKLLSGRMQNDRTWTTPYETMVGELLPLQM